MSDNGDVRDEVVSIAEATGIAEDVVADYWTAKIDEVSISTMAAESDRTGYDVQTNVESVVEALTDDVDPLLDALRTHYKPPEAPKDNPRVWAYTREDTAIVTASKGDKHHCVRLSGALGETKQQYRDVTALKE